MFPSWSKPNALFLGSFLLDLLIFFFYFSIASPSVTSVSSLNPGDYIFLVLIPKSLTIFYTTMRSSIISSKTYSRKPQHLRKEKEKRIQKSRAEQGSRSKAWFPGGTGWIPRPRLPLPSAVPENTARRQETGLQPGDSAPASFWITPRKSSRNGCAGSDNQPIRLSFHKGMGVGEGSEKDKNLLF